DPGTRAAPDIPGPASHCHSCFQCRRCARSRPPLLISRAGGPAERARLPGSEVQRKPGAHQPILQPLICGRPSTDSSEQESGWRVDLVDHVARIDAHRESPGHKPLDSATEMTGEMCAEIEARISRRLLVIRLRPRETRDRSSPESEERLKAMPRPRPSE